MASQHGWASLIPARPSDLKPEPPTNLWCNAHNLSGAQRKFLYLGSDIDVALLRLLQPWETRARLHDSFIATSQAMLPNHVFSDYARGHAQDTRPSYRETTLSLRPLDPANKTARSLLSALVLRRLRDDAAATGAWSSAAVVSSAPELRFSFVMDGVRRTMQVVVGDALHEHILARLVSTMSTLAIVGLYLGQHDWDRLLRHARQQRVQCFRVLVAESDEDEVRGSLKRNGHAEVTRRLVARKARHSDARLQGHDRVVALCVTLFDTRMQGRQSR